MRVSRSALGQAVLVAVGAMMALVLATAGTGAQAPPGAAAAAQPPVSRPAQAAPGRTAWRCRPAGRRARSRWVRMPIRSPGRRR